MNEVCNKEIIKGLNKAFETVLKSVGNGNLHFRILECFEVKYLLECDQMFDYNDDSFYRTIPTFRIASHLNENTNVVRKELYALEKIGLIEKTRSSNNNCNWSIKQLEGFRNLYSDEFQLIK